MATRGHRRRSPTPMPRRLGGRGRSSVLGYGASDTRAVVTFEDNVLSNCDFLIDGSTQGKRRHLRRRRSRLRRVRRRRPERVRAQHHLPRLRPVLLLEVVHGLTRRLSGRPGREARRRWLPAARLPGHRLRQEPGLRVRRAATPGPGALCFNIDGTPRPAIGPWNAGAG